MAAPPRPPASASASAQRQRQRPQNSRPSQPGRSVDDGGDGGGGTIVSIPPSRTSAIVSPPPTAAAAASTLPASAIAGVGGAAGALDPESLLDAVDSFSSGSRYSSAGGLYQPRGSNPVETDGDGDGGHPRPQQPNFNPIEFLNSHYQTESTLLTALPSLRVAIDDRIVRLDSSIASALRRQAADRPRAAAEIVRARAAAHRLAGRIEDVRARAAESEAAVLEITRDMKRLDRGKRHLQRTITALKRLHMLLHAAEQLRMAAEVHSGQPVPRYRAAAHLIDATRLLLGHFDGYMKSVPKMRQVRDAVGVLRVGLREGIVVMFREVGFGDSQRNNYGATITDGSDGEPKEGVGDGSGSGAAPSSAAGNGIVRTTLTEACFVIESLGPKSRENFVQSFISEHLAEYDELFDLSPAAIGEKSKKGVSGKESATSSLKSIKRVPNSEGSGGGDAADDISSSSLDGGVERRFAWYRGKLRDLESRFPSQIFPSHWTMHYLLTKVFLQRTGGHLKFVLRMHNAGKLSSGNGVSGGGGVGGNSSSNGGGAGTGSSLSTVAASLSASMHGMKQEAAGSSVATGETGVDGSGESEDEKRVTALLRALQKTILFEKEMQSWLARDFGTDFLDPDADEVNDAEGADRTRRRQGLDEKLGTNEELEFDEQGHAVPASSAKGIRIKYERRRRKLATSGGGNERMDEGGGERSDDVSANNGGGPVSPLLGTASSVFDNFMFPYVAAEGKSMDELLRSAQSDDRVDARGALPLLTSSTGLFIYMKNSIARCTVLTREKTFWLLQREFQKKLRKYANVLEGKLPLPLPQTSGARAALSAAGMNLSQVGVAGGGTAGASTSSSTAASSSFARPNAAYRISAGEEVTICHVIDTCEYCTDTVEALEDLIRDKIGASYKEKIDMSGEQDAFHDVMAKSLRILTAGLEQRLDAALKEMSRTNWGTFDMVGEESTYVRSIHGTIHPFVVQLRGLLPSSYFRSFCDKFAAAFAATYYQSLVGLKKISEAGTQQLLLDVYNIKTLMLRLPVLDGDKKPASSPGGGGVMSRSLSAGSTIPPAMYTKMVTKEFRRIEGVLKLVGSPKDLLLEMFRAQWEDATPADLQTVMNLKGLPRAEQTAMMENFGVDSDKMVQLAADSSMTANMQTLQERGSDVAAKVNADLSQMRQRVDDFRKAFR